MLNGTRVLFDGVAAPLIRVDSGQVTASATVVIGAASPTLLTFDPSGTGPCAAINLDGTLNSVSTPAPAGSIVSLFLIGAGASSQADETIAAEASSISPAPMVVVGTQLAQVLYAGESPDSAAALTQINIQLPSSISGQPGICARQRVRQSVRSDAFGEVRRLNCAPWPPILKLRSQY